MHLFGKLKINPQDRREILEYLDSPNLSKWNNIANTLITSRDSLWRAVAKVKHNYFNQWDENKIMWRTYPDSITLARAIKNAIKEEQEYIEDSLFFPGPSAA